jgi:arginyl-tRNA synthetase
VIRDLIQKRVAEAVARLAPAKAPPVEVDIQDPRDSSHGDFACSYALAAAKGFGLSPRDLAEKIKNELLTNDSAAENDERRTTNDESSTGNESETVGGESETVGGESETVGGESETVGGIASPLGGEAGERSEPGGGASNSSHVARPISRLFASIEVAGPGFLNFRVTDEAWLASVTWANERAADLPKPQDCNTARPQLRLNVEFVSVNPNGPITVGSGRGAAFGSTLCNVLEAAGHEVHREYYINDGTNSEQMRLFAESVRAHALGQPLPDNGYKGDYVAAVGERLRKAGDGQDVAWFKKASEDVMIALQKEDLGKFAVRFDTWFSEQSLHDSGKVEEALAHLLRNGSADEEPVRRKLQLAKGGVVEDVEIEVQPVEEEEEPLHSENADGVAANYERRTTNDDADPPRPTHPASRATLWLRSTKFADDMDRVLRRKDGRLTYIASDVAYHEDKFNRPANADKLITILGPDHHGYIGRLHAVLAALELDEGNEETETISPISPIPLNDIERKLYRSEAERDACRVALEKAKSELEVIIFQIVRFVKDGKPAPMRKRDGNIYSLRDLIVEIGNDASPHATPEEQLVVGKDVARFFYLMRSHDTHMDFDIDLATKGTEENPVFYVQYAHARICSILRKSQEIDDLRLTIDDSPSAYSPTASESGSPTLHPKETALIKKILDLPEEVRRCAEDYGVHRLTTYAIELARAFHHFYDACRVIQPENPALSRRRLALCEATRHALRGALALLGVSAPERMEREGPPPCFERSEK